MPTPPGASRVDPTPRVTSRVDPNAGVRLTPGGPYDAAASSATTVAPSAAAAAGTADVTTPAAGTSNKKETAVTKAKGKLKQLIGRMLNEHDKFDIEGLAKLLAELVAMVFLAILNWAIQQGRPGSGTAVGGQPQEGTPPTADATANDLEMQVVNANDSKNDAVVDPDDIGLEFREEDAPSPMAGALVNLAKEFEGQAGVGVDDVTVGFKREPSDTLTQSYDSNPGFSLMELTNGAASNDDAPKEQQKSSPVGPRPGGGG